MIHVSVPVAKVWWVVIHWQARPRSLDTVLHISGRELLHLSSHTWLIQVLPGHPLANPKKDETGCINTKKDKPMS